jgi:hypothetical protein
MVDRYYNSALLGDVGWLSVGVCLSIELIVGTLPEKTLRLRELFVASAKDTLLVVGFLVRHRWLRGPRC